jgi:hypothetical protein
MNRLVALSLGYSSDQIAAILFELDTSVHKNDGITDWAPPKSEEWF